MKLASLLLAAGIALAPVAAFAAENQKEPVPQEWSWAGLGHFDQAQVQRGYQVYKEVCSACHGMHLMAFRNLSDEDGPGFTAAQVKAIAASFQVPSIDDKGEPNTRPGTPADRFPSPYANPDAAKAANNGAIPPDLSVIIKARHGGPDYVYAILTGYSDPPEEMKAKMMPGLNYNPYFANAQIAMPAPLTTDGQVTYADGNPPATKEQMAKDVVAFLSWASEPRQIDRKEMGVKVLIFLFVTALLLYFAYKRVWRDVDH